MEKKKRKILELSQVSKRSQNFYKKYKCFFCEGFLFETKISKRCKNCKSYICLTCLSDFNVETEICLENEQSKHNLASIEWLEEVIDDRFQEFNSFITCRIKKCNKKFKFSKFYSHYLKCIKRLCVDCETPYCKHISEIIKNFDEKLESAKKSVSNTFSAKILDMKSELESLRIRIFF